jgi:hypothetical protein
MTLVAAGAGVTICEPVIARGMAGPDVVLRRPLTHALAMLAPPRGDLTRLAAAFADQFTPFG